MAEAKGRRARKETSRMHPVDVSDVKVTGAQSVPAGQSRPSVCPRPSINRVRLPPIHGHIARSPFRLTRLLRDPSAHARDSHITSIHYEISKHPTQQGSKAESIQVGTKIQVRVMLGSSQTSTERSITDHTLVNNTTTAGPHPSVVARQSPLVDGHRRRRHKVTRRHPWPLRVEQNFQCVLPSREINDQHRHSGVGLIRRRRRRVGWETDSVRL